MNKSKSKIFIYPNQYSHLNKKGMSGIVVTLIIIGIALAAVGIVWYVLNIVIEEQAGEVTSASGNVFQSCSQAGISTWTPSCTGIVKYTGGQKCCDDGLPSVYSLLNNQPDQEGNLLDSSTWVVGSSGSQPGFSQNGQTSENSIELGTGPYGDSVALWKGGNDADSNADGGWNTPGFTVNPLKAYRYTVWIKKSILSGSTYFGLQSNVGLLGGGSLGNPYFFCGQLPQADRWYLIVGYILPSDTTRITGGLGGIYDGVTKQKVRSFTTTTGNCNSDYKHLPGDTIQTERAYLFYDTNTANRQWFYDPRVEVDESIH